MAPEVVNQYIVYTGSGTVGTTLTPEYQTENTTPNNTVADQILSRTDILKICIYLVILIMGVIGNGLVIFVTGYKMKTTVNSVWFLNLAIADFIFVFYLIINIIVTFNKFVWPFSDLMCKFTSLVAVLNMFASIFLLTAISLDRCLCTWLIVWVQNKRTLNKGRIICISVWILSICCSIPFTINGSVQELNGLKYCVYNSTNLDVLVSLFTYRFLVGFLIPFLIIASSYIAIGVRVKRLKRGKQLRPLRVILSVILGFFICWFPLHVQHLCHLSAVKYNWSDSVQKVIYSAGPFIQCLVFLNSCLNPILYVFMCDEYKTKLKKSLLLVFEAAFSEEHLRYLTSRRSTSCYSVSLQGEFGKQTNDTTISSSGSGQGRTSF
ncbi:C3a anaphylatoxin chemotactic receptor isoform X1 [Misgurnus anguillicaudatus]|uniref:C3a anaphylatoxin chemotactic receptor isoform X1 n=1 Tax=Misgurnus anguillicaudatus TaxID=75329 RepID=UPI003CCFAD4A